MRHGPRPRASRRAGRSPGARRARFPAARAASVRRPNPIKKRLCHVFLALEERELKESRKDRAKRQKQERQRLQAAQKAAAPPEAAPKKAKEEKK
mgnify:CR=1 FL=1